jgi:hypothetical protein
MLWDRLHNEWRVVVGAKIYDPGHVGSPKQYQSDKSTQASYCSSTGQNRVKPVIRSRHGHISHGYMKFTRKDVISSGARPADFISSDVRASQVEDRRFDAEGVGPGCCCVTLAVKGWNDRKAKGDQDTGPIG